MVGENFFWIFRFWNFYLLKFVGTRFLNYCFDLIVVDFIAVINRRHECSVHSLLGALVFLFFIFFVLVGVVNRSLLFQSEQSGEQAKHDYEQYKTSEHSGHLVRDTVGMSFHHDASEDFLVPKRYSNDILLNVVLFTHEKCRFIVVNYFGRGVSSKIQFWHPSVHEPLFLLTERRDTEASSNDQIGSGVLLVFGQENGEILPGDVVDVEDNFVAKWA